MRWLLALLFVLAALWPAAAQQYPIAVHTTAGCTVGTSSGQCLAAGRYRFVQVQNTSAAASIACAWGGAAALNSSGSAQLSAGQPASWGTNTSGVPQQALNCIASAASTPLFLEYWQ